MARPISFLSDYGLDDEFVGVVHGVVARISAEIKVIDVTHHVARGDVRAGALALLRGVQYLPPGVALAVVDPGVGTDRKALAVETEWGHFVGPDNGLLAPAVAMVGGATRMVSIEEPAFRLPGGGTFDGRDVFAPAAAVLAAGEASLTDLGPEIAGAAITPLLLPLVDHGEGLVDGEVFWVDHFGNAQTNVSPDDLELIGLRPGDTLVLRVGATLHQVRWETAYGSGDDPMIHTDSYGMIAIAVPGGRADDRLNLSEGLSVGFRSLT